MPTPGPPLQTPPHRGLEILLFGLLGFLLSLAVSSQVFHWNRITGDEASYVFQAYNFLDGVVRREAPVFHALLRYDMIILDPEHGWLSRYSPGHPLWLLPGVALGLPHLMVALAAGISLASAYEIGRRLRIPRFLLPGLMAASPFFLLVHGTLLSHTSGLAMVSLMFLFYLLWRQERHTVWAAASGLCWSFFLLNRTWTALLLALPFAVDALVQLSKDRKSPRTWAGTALFAACALVGIALYMSYNAISTGDAGTATYLLYEESEGLGFGPRRTQGGNSYEVDHTPLRGLRILGTNLGMLDHWMTGTPFALLVWLGLTAHGWSRRWSSVLFATVLVIPLGYVAFWFPGIPEVGPIYYAEILLFLFILGSLGLSRIWRRSDARPRLRLALFSIGYLLLAANAFRFIGAQTEKMKADFASDWELQALIDTLPDQSLLFYPAFRDTPRLRRYVGFNPRGLDSRVLQLESRAANNPAIAACFPDRKAFSLREEPSLRLEPLDVPFGPMLRNATDTHHSRGSARNEGDWRVADGSRHVPGFLLYGWYSYLPPGRYEVRFDLRWEDVKPEAPLRLEIMANLGSRTLVQRNLTDRLENTTLAFTLDEATHVEPRIHFGGRGIARVRSLELVPMDLEPPTSTQTP